MVWEKLQVKALFWLAVGGGVLAVGLAKDYFPRRLQAIPHLFGVAVVAGSILILYGIASGIVFKTYEVQQPVEAVLTKFLRRNDQDRWGYIEYAQRSDLPLVYDCFEREFGKDVPSIELMESWLNRCSTCLALLYFHAQDHFHSETKFFGCYKLLPLTKKGVLELEANRTSGSTLPAEYICDAKQKPAAYYVGDLFAEKQGSARAAILFHLDYKCRELVDMGFPIYARPFTREGQRVMIKRGFLQVSNNSLNLELRQLCRLTRTPRPVRKPVAT